jgi:hypothetical protein
MHLYLTGIHVRCRNVLAKLLVFSLAIIALPISTYFISVDRLFSGNATYGAILAIIMTNVLIALYVVAAFMEDREDKVRKKED